MRSFRFTLRELRDLPVPDKRTRYMDQGQDGLAAYLYPSGARAFYLFKRVDGHLQERRLGDVEALSVDEARRQVQDLLVAARKGERVEPARVARRGGQTFGDLWDWWAKEFGEPQRSRWLATEQTYKKWIKPKIGLRPMAMLTRSDVKALHRAIGVKYERTANVVLGLIRVVVNQAIREEVWAGTNPAAYIRAYKRPARRRYLTREELPRFLEALKPAPPDLRDLALLLLTTGQRRGNVMARRWDQIDFEYGCWIIPKTKAGHPHAVALVPQEIALLRQRQAGSDSPWVFPSKSVEGHVTDMQKGWKGITARAKLVDLRPHDLRRTNAEWLLKSGARTEVVSRILDHSSVEITEQVYLTGDLEMKNEAKLAGLAAMGIQNVIGPS